MNSALSAFASRRGEFIARKPVLHADNTVPRRAVAGGQRAPKTAPDSATVAISSVFATGKRPPLTRDFVRRDLYSTAADRVDHS
jgi:hypothetical protein